MIITNRFLPTAFLNGYNTQSELKISWYTTKNLTAEIAPGKERYWKSTFP